MLADILGNAPQYALYSIILKNGAHNSTLVIVSLIEMG